MKPISELGLETIQLENQVLLVDPNEASQEGDWIYWNKRPVKAIDTTYSKDTKYIIASTKPLEGLPLLVIEDEGEIESFKIFPVSIDTRNNITKDINSLERTPFIKGYNKAKEVFRFTEEDLRKVIELARMCDSDCGGVYWENGVEYIIQSLTKKELWVEVEEWSLAENVTAKNQNILKITNGQIKAVWN